MALSQSTVGKVSRTLFTLFACQLSACYLLAIKSYATGAQAHVGLRWTSSEDFAEKVYEHQRRPAWKCLETYTDSRCALRAKHSEETGILGMANARQVERNFLPEADREHRRGERLIVSDGVTQAFFKSRP